MIKIRNGKRDAQSMTEMIADGQNQKKGNQLYSGQSHKVQAQEASDQRISDLVHGSVEEMASLVGTEKVSLTDVEALKFRTIAYLRSCEESAVLPSTTGLARSLGHSRQSLYDYAWRNPGSETANWLDLFKDVCSELLATASLKGDCQPIVSIFLQKSMYGLRESVEIVARQEDSPIGPNVDQDDLRRRIENSIPIDDFDETEDY